MAAEKKSANRVEGNSTFDEGELRYIMVGGFATRFHGFNRNTDDLDMWLEDSVENRRNLRKSFQLNSGKSITLRGHLPLLFALNPRQRVFYWKGIRILVHNKSIHENKDWRRTINAII
jgi:hypothetical protein